MNNNNGVQFSLIYKCVSSCLLPGQVHCVLAMFSHILSTKYNRAVMEAWTEYILTDGEYWTTASVYDWLFDNADNITTRDGDDFLSGDYAYLFGEEDDDDYTMTLVFEAKEVSLPFGISSTGIQARVLELDVTWKITTMDDLSDRMIAAKEDCKNFWDRKWNDDMWDLENVLERKCKESGLSR